MLFLYRPLHGDSIIDQPLIEANQNFRVNHSNVQDYQIGQHFAQNELQSHNKSFWGYISSNWSTLHSEYTKMLLQDILRLKVSKSIKHWLWISYNIMTSHFEVADCRTAQPFNWIMYELIRDHYECIDHWKTPNFTRNLLKSHNMSF